MFRKLAIAFAATAALGAASLASTPAEAKKWGGYHKHHHHHGHHHHFRYRYLAGPALVSYAHTGCYVKRWVATPWGYQLRWVNRCY